jgi:hypothetical protein
VPPRSIQNRQPPGPPSDPDDAMAVVGVASDVGSIIAQSHPLKLRPIST